MSIMAWELVEVARLRPHEQTLPWRVEEMVEKIAKGKLSKFLNDNSLMNQLWIMDPKKKVSEILKENSLDKQIKVLNFLKYKVGEGI